MRKNLSILAVNTGSSSLKFCLFRAMKEVLRGEFENIGQSNALFWVKGQLNFSCKKKFSMHFQAVQELLTLCQKIDQAKLDLIAHRFVFGGDQYIKPTVLTEATMKNISRWSFIAPQHIPQEIKVVKAVETFFPKVKQIACFDTSFHTTLLESAKTIPISNRYLAKGFRRFGFHGLSCEYICEALPKTKKKVIVAHLGHGVSLTAIKNRKSLDTTMGLTPLGGIIMGSRSGDIDPGLILYLLKEKKISSEELDHLLNYESGLKAISKTSSDMHKLLTARKNHNVQLAIDKFCYDIAKQIGAFFVTLSGIDAIVFTGGIGYRSSKIRQMICDKLKCLGVQIDKVKNQNHEKVISSSSSRGTLYAIETNEEYVLAQHASQLF